MMLALAPTPATLKGDQHAYLRGSALGAVQYAALDQHGLQVGTCIGCIFPTGVEQLLGGAEGAERKARGGRHCGDVDIDQRRVAVELRLHNSNGLRPRSCRKWTTFDFSECTRCLVDAVG